MAEYSDLGTYLMKLFDPLIAECKEKMVDCQKNFIRDMPRKVASQTSVSISRAEGFARDISDQLMRINQDLLNQYAVSIAKKTRNYNKKNSQTIKESLDEFKISVAKKDKEIDGLQAQAKSLEQRARILEKEKEETLQQVTLLNNMINELQNRLTSIEEEYKYQMSQLNNEWEEKFRKNQEEWDSYMKLKLAEHEMSDSSKSESSKPEIQQNHNIEPKSDQNLD